MTNEKYATNLKHGHKRNGKVSPTYRIWLGMKRRCFDDKFKDYPKYGAVGITVCERWNTSFENFLSDMGERPSLKHSIDRLDPTGNYEPSNCQWATLSEQGAFNKRSLKPVTVDDITYPSISAACRAYGIKKTAINWRLKNGFGLEEAFKTPTWKLPNKRPRESYLRKDRR